MRYILVRDICECEDYPCCGHDPEPYPRKEEDARKLAKEGKVRLIAYVNPITGALSPLPENRIENFEEHKELIERFIEYAEAHPSDNIEYRSKDYNALVDLTFELIDGMEADEAFDFKGEVIQACAWKPALREHVSVLAETIDDCDWSDDCLW